jgi:ABC-2 type transport system permease protein
MNALRVYRYGLMVGWQEFKGYWTIKTWLSGWAVQMVAQAAFFSLLGELLGSPDYLRFLAIGFAIGVGAYAANWAISASTWDRFDGTYPLLVIAPSSLLPAVLGRSCVWAGNGIATSVMAFGALRVVFGLELPWPETLLALALIPLCSAGVYSFVLFESCIVTRVPRLRNTFLNASSTLFNAFCGISVPVSFWPGWVQVLANLLPLTHAVHAVRLVLDRGPAEDVAYSVLYALLTTAAWMLAAMLTMDRMADAGRRSGSIEYV